jgi:xanthine dehydrogenase YagR molybdenum-binding subunit
MEPGIDSRQPQARRSGVEAPREELSRGLVIGEPIDRLDGPRKVTGLARYAFEYRSAGEAAYGFIVGSTIAKGRILSIESTAAERAPGVLAVLTHRNAPSQAPPHPPATANRYDRAQPVLFSPEVRYYGEPVALVVAETYEAAREAASRIEVHYERDTSARLDLERYRPEGYKPEGGQVNAGAPTDTAEGDFDRAFERAPATIDVTYTVPYEHNMPMEPHASLAVWEDGSLTLYTSQQGVQYSQSTLAKTLQIPAERVRIVTPYVGGGFGSKVPTHAQAILAALAARSLGRPVKVAQTRQQMFALSSHRPRGIQRVRLGAERDGRLTAISHDVWMQTAPYDEFIEQCAAFGRVMYAAPNRSHRHWGVKLDLPASDIMRAPGEEPGSIAFECAMDELAASLGVDPVELRIRNEPDRDPETHLPFSSRSLVQCLKEGARRFGWESRPPWLGMRRDEDRAGGLLIGQGVASAMFPTNMRPCRARVRIEPDGTVRVFVGATDIGTGTYTVLAQVAAQRLGVPVEQVSVELGDSRLPAAPPSGGSMAAASTSTAVLLACDELQGRLCDRSRDERLEDFMRRAAPRGLEAEAGHDGLPRPKRYSTQAYGAQFAEVGVDPDTGEVRVRRMLGVFACGRILNAKTARSQLVGGMIMGLGAALTEESLLDTRHGVFINHDLAEYHIPVHADVSEIDAVLLPENEPYVNPLGIKGLGEIGIVGAAAAIANAVFDATGVRVREFPVTLDKVLSGLAARAQHPA